MFVQKNCHLDKKGDWPSSAAEIRTTKILLYYITDLEVSKLDTLALFKTVLLHSCQKVNRLYRCKTSRWNTN